MNELTNEEAVALALAAIQCIRKQFKAEKQLTASTAATLLTGLSAGEVRQADLPALVGDLDPAAISKHLDLLEGRKRTNRVVPLMLRKIDDDNRRFYKVEVTPEGRVFQHHLTEDLNRTLRRLRRER